MPLANRKELNPMSKGQNKKDPNPWVTQHTKLVYSNPWIQVQEHQVLNPAGNPGIYGVVSFKNVAVGIVPIDSQGFTYLVGQYRYPLNTYSWEIIEGGCPIGEPLLLGAQRELAEETGLSAAHFHYLLDLHTSNSVTDEHATVFIATGLEQGTALPEETEQLTLQHCHIDQAIEWAKNGTITDAISLAALLKIDSLKKNAGWPPNPNFLSELPRPQIWEERYPL
jgi:8-oxo-dGTP pyrophosphatase MutT (NUDIX family)